MACQNTEFAKGIPLLMLNLTPPVATKVSAQSPCPCGTQTSFEHCCAPRLNGTAAAHTAEQLMRSRYTAHVLGDIDYLVRTWHVVDPSEIDREAIRHWALSSDWRGLTVHHTVKGGPEDAEGWVEFTAAYVEKPAADGSQLPATQTLKLHREKSYFIHKQGLWLYVEGESVEEERVQKLGRNSPCPCGSGKKFKRCCNE
jgi:SEC-C motif-containing protein